MGEMELQTESENEELSLAKAANAEGAAAKKLTAIAQARNGLTLGELLGTDTASIASSVQKVSAWQESLAAPLNLFSGIAESIERMNAWQDNLAAIAAAQQEKMQQSLAYVAGLYEEEQQARERYAQQYLANVTRLYEEEQKQTQKTMQAAFASLSGWQYPWPGAAPRQQPAQRAPEPEPPAEQVIEVVQIEEPITLEGLNVALAEGRLPWREVMQLAMQHMPNAKRGRKEPPIPEQLALVEGWYGVRGKMLQQRYCDKVGISKASLNRYERTCKALGLI